MQRLNQPTSAVPERSRLAVLRPFIIAGLLVSTATLVHKVVSSVSPSHLEPRGDISAPDNIPVEIRSFTDIKDGEEILGLVVRCESADGEPIEYCMYKEENGKVMIMVNGVTFANNDTIPGTMITATEIIHSITKDGANIHLHSESYGHAVVQSDDFLAVISQLSISTSPEEHCTIAGQYCAPEGSVIASAQSTWKAISGFCNDTPPEESEKPSYFSLVFKRIEPKNVIVVSK